MLIRPTEGRISSPFGMRTHPVTLKPSSMHWGIDIAKTGTVPILAAADGAVSRVQKDGTFGTYGNLVMIVHNIGVHTYETVYAHLKSIDVSNGQKVKSGQRIGLMGNTGGSTGQHLHFEVHSGRWNNKYSNAKNPVHFMVDPDVKVLQQLLVKVGHKITVDGINGPGTESAVKAFQKLSGLVVDGSAGPATMAVLENAISTEEEESIVASIYKPTSQAIVNSTSIVLQRLEKKENDPLSPKWREKLQDGTLTDSDAIGLLYVAIERGHIVGKQPE